MALNRQSSSFYAVPGEIKNPKAVATKLSRTLGVSQGRLERRFRSRKAFVWIKRKVGDQVAKQVDGLGIAGVHELKETTRVYPEGKLACHILGFVGMDNQGLGGVELKFDSAIRGQSGWIRINRDAKGRRLPTATRVHKQSQSGQDVYLTIDKVIQHIAERELGRAMTESRAKAGSVVIMNSKTGEVLAMANKPDFDPNYFNRVKADHRRNRAITDVYEPGSTMKIVAASAALEEGVYLDADIIDCENGRAKFYGMTVRDHEPRGRLTFRDVIVYSSNIGAVKIGIRLGAKKMAQYLQMYGFGKPTGIELPGESRGIVKPFAKWKRWTEASVPFGQGMAVTSIQLMAAYTAIANNGRVLKPWIIKEMRHPDEIRTKVGKTEYQSQVVSPGTAAAMRSILRDVVVRGSGVAAGLDNYQVAGKTGTAQKPLSNGRGYDPVYHVASFIGFFPADEPEFLIGVMIDAPQGVQWGGVVAGPVFRKISRKLVSYLGIPPGPQKVYAFAKDYEKDPMVQLEGIVRVPKVTGLSVRESKAVLKKEGLLPVCLGKGTQVVSQRPFADQWSNRDSRVILYMADSEGVTVSEATLTKSIVPNLSGQSMRNALLILEQYGLHADISGSGVVKHQDPKPYARISLGEHCSIVCEDPEE